MINMKNKKGVAPFIIIAIFLLVLVVIYMILLIPIPSVQKIRMLVNYFLVIIFFILIQAVFIYLYATLGKLAFKGVNLLRFKIMNWTKNINKYIITHT